MRFSRRHRDHRIAEISVVPLIDLFLNILVFFLVTTTFGADSVFFVELPETQEGKGIQESKQVTISVSSTGELAINKRAVTQKQLQEELGQIPDLQRKSFPVVVRADRKALHGTVVSVLDMIRQAGFENIGMATKVQVGNGK